MSWSTRVKNFLKTGKLDSYEQAKNLLLGDTSGEELFSALDSLSREGKEKLLTECWLEMSDTGKKVIVDNLYRRNWPLLTEDYAELTELEKIKRIEILGYVSHPEVISFLLEEMKNKREGIRLSACGALKNQDPELVLEPILKALTEPEQWLPSRIFEVLRGMGPGLDQRLLSLMEGTDEKVQEVIIQILGELGDKTCIPVFERVFPRSGPLLRQRMAEALEKLKIPESWPLLVKLLDENRWQTRMLAAKALGQLGHTQVIPILLEARLAEEKDPMVKECIIDAISALEEKSLQIVGNWVRKG